MKQLTCEMCGSTDLMKQDGVFVCQTCGTKYSLEEARKMMIEGTVDVSGSKVTIDSSAKLNNILTLAKRAKKENNGAEAQKYFEMALLEDPNNWEASFFSSYYKLSNVSDNAMGPALNGFFQRANTTLEFILSSQVDPDFEDNMIEVIATACEISSSVHRYVSSRMRDIMQEKQRCIMAGRRFPSYLLQEHRTVRDNVSYVRKGLIGLYSQLAAAISWDNAPQELIRSGMNLLTTVFEKDVQQENECGISDRPGAAVDFVKWEWMVRDFDPDFRSNVLKKFREYCERNCKEVLKDIDTAEKYERSVRADKYWADHPDQKVALEKEVSELDGQIQALQAQITSADDANRVKIIELERKNRTTFQPILPGDKEYESQKKRISQLEQQLASLSFFKRKEKKALTEQLEQTERPLLDKLKFKAMKEHQEYTNEINSQISNLKSETVPLKMQLADLEAKKNQVVFQLENPAK